MDRIKIGILFSSLMTASLPIYALCDGINCSNHPLQQYLLGLPAAPPGSDLADVLSILDPLRCGDREDALNKISSRETLATRLATEDSAFSNNRNTSRRLAYLRNNYIAGCGNCYHDDPNSDDYKAFGRNPTNDESAVNQAPSRRDYASGDQPTTDKRTRSSYIHVARRLAEDEYLDRCYTYPLQENGSNRRTRNNSSSDRNGRQLITDSAYDRGLCDGGFWAQGLGSYSRQFPVDDRRFTARTLGFMLGLDGFLTCHFISGIGFGYTDSRLRWQGTDSTARVENIFANAYASWFNDDGFYLDVSLLGGCTSVRAERNIAFSSINRTATNRHKGMHFTPHIGAGLAYDVNRCFFLEPFVAVDYAYIRENGYTEIGANALNLEVQGGKTGMLRSEIGLAAFSTDPVHCRGAFLTTRVSLSFVRKKPIKRSFLVATLQGQPGSFRIGGYNQTKNLISPSLGFLLQFQNCMFLSASYNGEFGERYRNHEIGFRLGASFY